MVLHMADSELIRALRLRKLIAEPGSTLMPYDEPKWAQALDYRSQNTDDALGKLQAGAADPLSPAQDLAR